MTRLMKQAIEQLKAIPESQQDSLAQFLINELEEDDRWSRSTKDHESQLQSLVGTILDDDQHGKCEQLDADRL
jgi:hypothetical protein